MRSSVADKHISGAERIVEYTAIDNAVQELVTRAKGKGLVPEQIAITIEFLGSGPFRMLTALDVVTLNAPDMIRGRDSASQVLHIAGVSRAAAKTAIRHLSVGSSPSGGNMRGAMIMDAQTGERLEPDRERGIRASRYDWDEETSHKIQRKLATIGLTHYRTHEALALATKVAHAPGIIAELCWSDDPDYTAGYVASLRTGYVRFPFLKQEGDDKGGRVFFVDRDTIVMNSLILYLQTEAVLITDIGECRPSIEPEDYFDTLT